ncbi:hypothetical protein N2152v2_001210 [Parachlorella kessleri]
MGSAPVGNRPPPRRLLQRVAVLSTVGQSRGLPKAHNQDSFLVEQLALSGGPGSSRSAPAATLVGVFDGHGQNGHKVAGLVASAVQEHISLALHQAASMSSASYSDEDACVPLVDRGLWWDTDPASTCSNLSSAAALATEDLVLTPTSAQSGLEQTFSRVAESVAAASSSLTYQSGSTAVLCLILQDSVVAAWAGDSRAVVGKRAEGEWYATQLTQDHKPNRLSEMARIVAAGGRVSRPHPAGPFRVCLPGYGERTALSVARAFGDFELARIGIVPTPEFAVFTRSAAAASSAAGPTAAAASNNTVPFGRAPPASCSSARACAPATETAQEILLVASDGLWEVVGNEEAIELAAAAGSPTAGAAQLAELAKCRWAEHSGSRHQDDITVAVVYL